MTTITINPGTPAEETLEVPDGAIAFKYADPTQGWCWVYTEELLREVEAEDPSLIVRVEEGSR